MGLRICTITNKDSLIYGTILTTPRLRMINYIQFGFGAVTHPGFNRTYLTIVMLNNFVYNTPSQSYPAKLQLSSWKPVLSI